MKHLLVIGGSFAGLTVITHIRNMRITLLDSRSFFEYTPSVFEVMVNPERLFDMILEYKHLAQTFGFTFIQGSLVLLIISRNASKGILPTTMTHKLSSTIV